MIEALLAAPDAALRSDAVTTHFSWRHPHRPARLGTHPPTCAVLELGTGAHLRCRGKGRKERITPLTAEVVAGLRVWLAERHGAPDEPVFPSRRRAPLSGDAVAVLVTRHVRTATNTHPSLAAKTVTPHVLRHTCAMRLLAVGVDTSLIALWLGHESVETTQIYLHADLAIKERALARTAPTGTRPGRYRPPDTLLAFLENL